MDTPVRLIIEDDHEAMSRRSADVMADVIRDRRQLLLCPAAGGTPTRAYQLLAEKKHLEPDLFDTLRVIKLDEWGGLAMDDPATCEVYLDRSLRRPLGVSDERYVGFRSDPDDPRAECERIQARLERVGPIDLCVLGLGANGHLGFNEPAETLPAFAHVSSLAPTSLEHPMLASARSRVRYGLTLGLADVLGAGKVLLLVSGQAKSGQVRKLFSRRISTRFPASLLWLHHDVTCLCDRQAASELDH